MQAQRTVVAGIDVGTECIKAVVMTAGKEILGRSVVPTRGYFQDCVQEAFTAALDEAQVQRSDLAGICTTGFGARSVPDASWIYSESGCHALGAALHFPAPMTVIDIGGRNPNVTYVDARGSRAESRSVRRCATGIGTFLMFAARHLDVHPTRLEELAAAADKPALIGSYCSVFAGSEIFERLLEGATREQVALGCIESVAVRIYEVGDVREPVVITGGVPEFFPGVVKALARLTHFSPSTLPEPIMAGAVGAALRALQNLGLPGEAPAG